MLARNSRLDEDLLLRTVRPAYEGAGTELRFQPLGTDSWAYRCGSLWISVRRDFLGHLPQSYETAYALRGAGLDFVLAPLAGRDGRVLRTVQGFPVAVYPYLPVEPIGGAGSLTPRELNRIWELMSKVHTCDVATDLPVEDFRLPFEDRLSAGLTRALEPSRDAGPFSRRLRELVRRNGAYIAGLRERISETGERCTAARRPLSITHGDLNGDNVLRLGDDFVIADWQCALRAPAERDGYFCAREFGLPPQGDPLLHHFYALQWSLSEIAEYVITFTAEHGDTSDDRQRWLRLCSYLPES
ncbi:phosphotransferase [Nonomuraea sp. NPDC059007]|uniref:phosphotransferase n=1 Tax=Nonomuraea sp. NPDC059007 TaxID=3346692 RepID=UPI0036A38820